MGRQEHCREIHDLVPVVEPVDPEYAGPDVVFLLQGFRVDLANVAADSSLGMTPLPVEEAVPSGIS